jgi:hypothetical protein
MFVRKREKYKRHPTIVAWGINVVSKNEIPWNNTRLQAGLVPPRTISRKQVTAYSQQPCPLLQSYMRHVIPQPDDFINTPYSQLLHMPQKPGVSRYPKEQSANCNKYRDFSSYS